MDKENRIYLDSNSVWISETESDPDALIVKFVICDFERNKNGVSINRSRADEWISTLIHKPVVGKISINADGDDDFTSHNMKIETRENDDGTLERVVVFDTSAYGTFINTAVEKVNDVDCIVATAKVWKRYNDACDIIQRRIKEGTLHTSWEVIVEESSQQLIDGAMTRVIDKGRFIGHCLLSKYTEPAYDSSGILSVAEKLQGEEMSIDNSCLVAALLNTENKGGENNMEDANKIVPETTSEGVATTSEVTETEGSVVEDNTAEVVSETTVEDNQNTDPEPVTSSLTSDDIYSQIRKAMRAVDDGGYIMYWFPAENYVIWKPWETDDLSCIKATYTVEGDTVIIQSKESVKITFDPIALQAEYEKSVQDCSAKNDVIVTLNEKIQDYTEQIAALTSENESLKSFKQQYDEEVAEKAHAEEVGKIKAYALKSKVISEADIEDVAEVKQAIEAVDYTAIKAIISDRVVASTAAEEPIVSASDSNKTVTISSIRGFQTRIDATDDDIDSISGNEASKIMRKYFRK